jgi:hypothetical protein
MAKKKNKNNQKERVRTEPAPVIAETGEADDKAESKLKTAAKVSPEDRKKAIRFKAFETWQWRIARVLLVLVLCVQPLYLNADRYIRLTWHKFFFFAIYMGFIVLAIMIVWFIRLALKPRLFPQDRSLSTADAAVLVYALLAVISAIVSPFKYVTTPLSDTGIFGQILFGGNTYNPPTVWLGVSERYDGAITQLLYVVIYFTVSRWYKFRETDFVLFGISASAVSLIGILQFYGADIFSLWPNYRVDYYVPPGERFYSIFFRSTLGNINIVSTYVSAAVMLNGFLYVRRKSKWRPLWLAASALTFWMMDVAHSDSGRVGVIVAAVLAIPFIIDSYKAFARFLLLGSSWIEVLALQVFFYEILVRRYDSYGKLFVLLAVAAVLAVASWLLLRLKLPTADAQESKPPSADAASSDDKVPAKPGLVATLRRFVKRFCGMVIRFAKEPKLDDPIRWKRGVILLAVGIVAGGLMLEFIGRSEATGRVYEIRQMIHGNVNPRFGSNRIHIWTNALRSFANSPNSPDRQIANIFIGSGPDTFAQAFPTEAHGVYGESYDKAHNEYLQILICQGFLGLFAYVAFLGVVFCNAIKNAFKNPMLMAVMAGFTALCVQAFFNINLPICSQMLWVFAGLMANKKFNVPQNINDN